MRQRCRAYREVLEASPELCTPEELNDYWPGGRENQLPSPGCWTYCFGIYLAYLMRSKDSGDTSESRERAHQAALDAFREKPVVVELVARDAEGRSQSVTVYAKSYDTIAFVDELDADAHWLLDKIQQLGERWSAQDALHRTEALRRVTETQLLQCWIATHPGVDTPFPHGTADPILPPHVRLWDPIDLIQIMQAYLQVNRDRLALIAEALRPTNGGGKAVSFAVLGVAAAKAAGGGDAETLFRRRSLGSWFGQAALTWEAEREAQEAADRATHGARSRLPEMVG